MKWRGISLIENYGLLMNVKWRSHSTANFQFLLTKREKREFCGGTTFTCQRLLFNTIQVTPWSLKIWSLESCFSPLAYRYFVIWIYQAARRKEVPLEEVELYFNLSDKVRQFTEDYFQLDTPLYFSYSHLVCRTSLMGELNCFHF